MNAKLLLIILGALVALFFVGTSWGLLSDDQSVGGAAEAVVRMVRGLQDEEPLTSSDVIDTAPAHCREQLHRRQFILAAGQSCRLHVGEASDPVRTLTLRLQQGREAVLRMQTAGEDDTEQTQVLPTENEARQIELQFLSRGGQLTVLCRDGAGSQSRCVMDVL